MTRVHVLLFLLLMAGLTVAMMTWPLLSSLWTLPVYGQAVAVTVFVTGILLIVFWRSS